MSCLLDYDGIPCRKNRTVEPTNADLFRAMSDEKIAGTVCTGCPPGMETGKQCTGDGACYDCWLNWLQMPVGGDENDM